MTDGHHASALQHLLLQRSSCRNFQPRAVPQSTLEHIVTLAQRTASWCNAQPWQVHITLGAATDRFRTIMQAPSRPGEPAPDFAWPREYQGIYQSRRRDCGLALYESLGITRDDRAKAAEQANENFRFFGAPHVAMITTNEALGVYGAVDCGAYVANFLLAAASLGIATIPQAALAARPQRVKDFFGLPAERQVVCGISLGYADPDHPANSFRTARADIASSVQWVGSA